MVAIAIMVEGQDGINWSRWKEIVTTVEDAGYHGLFRSDHFTNEDGPRTDALELWVSLTWLAIHTERIEFGPLVTPVSFRDPVFIARMAKDIDDLSDGRLNLGVGAGWQEREHEAFGYDLLDVPRRFDRFEEGLTVIRDLIHETGPVSFDGEFYQLNEAQLLPRPQRPTPLVVGGNGRKRTLPLAAKFADEWNGYFQTPEQYADLNTRLDGLLEAAGRNPDEVTRSLMTRVIYGDDATVERLVEEDTFFDDDATIEDFREEGFVIGTGEDIAAHLERLDAAGADRVMLQWLELDALDRLEMMADEIL